MQTVAILFTMLLAPPASSRPLPDNPCEVLTAAELAAATGLTVTSVRRVPSIGEGVRAEREGRPPEPGTICSYDTNSPFGALSIWVPRRSERRSELYWRARSKYFDTFPGSAEHIPELGMDAWLAGGASLSVLIRENEHLGLSTQNYQRQSRDVLVKVARAIARR
jgi:hypothetical protein